MEFQKQVLKSPLFYVLISYGLVVSEKTDSLPKSKGPNAGAAYLEIQSSVFSFLILDSIPLGKITSQNEYRLLPGTHKIEIHNIGLKHFDTTIILESGKTLFTKTFPEREDPNYFDRRKKDQK